MSASSLRAPEPAPAQPDSADIVCIRTGAPIAPRKKQTTRMRKLVCNHCGFSCRTTAKHINAHPEGLICPDPLCDGDLERCA